MPYEVVFTDKEKDSVVIKASEARFNEKSKVMEFLDDKRMIVAYFPLDRVLYIKRVENK